MVQFDLVFTDTHPQDRGGPMSAAEYNIFIEQGANFPLNFRWKTGEPAAVVDIQGWSARMQGRTEFAATDKIFDLTTGNGKIEIDVDNYVRVTMLPAETATIGYDSGKKTKVTYPDGNWRYWWKVGVYDLELVDPSGNVTRVLYGDVYVSPEVTR